VGSVVILTRRRGWESMLGTAAQTVSRMFAMRTKVDEVNLLPTVIQTHTTATREGDLEHFKEFNEVRGVQIGAWRGEVQYQSDPRSAASWPKLTSVLPTSAACQVCLRRAKLSAPT
jgi:hypothetical protein